MKSPTSLIERVAVEIERRIARDVPKPLRVRTGIKAGSVVHAAG